MTAYYNENDPKAAAWLRELIKQGHIADGVVDDRSIKDVKPNDLEGFTQCHFFAGIGVWSLALRRAGWPDSRRVWTGSCPCQPFSAAGRGAGVVDERHLWPHLFHLITQREPSVFFGEQVASKDGLGWLDLVQADLENANYASAAVDLCAAGLGAPHIRQRLWFVAERLVDPDGAGPQEQRRRREEPEGLSPTSGATGHMADTEREQRQRRGPSETGHEPGQVERTERLRNASQLADPQLQQRQTGAPGSNETGERHEKPATPAGLHRDIGLADTDSSRQQAGRETTETARHGRTVDTTSGPAGHRPAGPTNGHWRTADWLSCRDGKWRAVEPGTFPLVNGAPARVGRLRGYGNAIVAPVAQAFIESYLETTTP